MEFKNFLKTVLAIVALLHAGTSSAEPVAVKHLEGLVHGFLSLRNRDW